MRFKGIVRVSRLAVFMPFTFTVIIIIYNIYICVCVYVCMYVCVLFFNDKCGQQIMITTNNGTGSREVDLGQVFL